MDLDNSSFSSFLTNSWLTQLSYSSYRLTGRVSLTSCWVTTTGNNLLPRRHRTPTPSTISFTERGLGNPSKPVLSTELHSSVLSSLVFQFLGLRLNGLPKGYTLNVHRLCHPFIIWVFQWLIVDPSEGVPSRWSKGGDRVLTRCVFGW